MPEILRCKYGDWVRELTKDDVPTNTNIHRAARRHERVKHGGETTVELTWPVDVAKTEAIGRLWNTLGSYDRMKILVRVAGVKDPQEAHPMSMRRWEELPIRARRKLRYGSEGWTEVGA